MFDLSLTGSELFLVLVWFAVSLWNTSVGPTGGVTFATMASVLPPTAVIPIQAVVESTSSVFRAVLLRQFIDTGFLLAFVVGGAAGFVIGLIFRFYTPPSDDVLRIIMGTAIIVTTWAPLSKIRMDHKNFPALVGMVTSFVSLFVGGVAALTAAALDHKHDDHRHVIATMTASLIFQHSVKVVIFGVLGFAFAAHAKLMVAMFLAATAGTWVGKRVLMNVPQHIIKPVFRILVTVLGGQVLIRGLLG